MEPFLPWPGSKSRSAVDIVAEFPRTCNTYYEPFLGSGAVFFSLRSDKLFFLNTNFKRAELSDVNHKLINTWRAVHSRPDEVAVHVERHCAKNSEEYYYGCRGNLWTPSVFIYVMRAAFSSMYRENQRGEFNVPWRKSDYTTGGRPISTNVEAILRCSDYMSRYHVNIIGREWHVAVANAESGDLVYFDPPFLPYSDTGFCEYSPGGFGIGDHVMLEKACRTLREKGVFVALSNSLTPASERIYGEPTKVLTVANAVKAKAKVKGKRQEGLWLYKP